MVRLVSVSLIEASCRAVVRLRKKRITPIRMCDSLQQSALLLEQSLNDDSGGIFPFTI
ncbi:hypothetical protein J2Z81_002416 [Virgibacillus campisalis]|uniref:Uncharacterized protein n=1 Tax=Virgibacillus alimentarius TaxID=698769 RepID=A0ABS4SA98_9BACI|nr:hypothetical protein [Virgibacillus alimentarius]